MSTSARQTVKPEVTLFSGPGHTGDRCVLPLDGSTYSLKATGLAKIVSVRVDWPGHEGAKPVVRLYSEVPTRYEDVAAGQGTTFKDFTADSADTGRWAGAKCVKGYADDGRRQAMNSLVDPQGERPILDVLADSDAKPEFSRPATGRGLFG
ncbi:hypothetical protein AB0M92_29615 [Streptomyces sp. NPDC051582]|uniref:hypothetical protein n=1 Tax=Streptomyces sp. NPDC051582 TaxID=3155167 RepID=UPI00343BB57A